MLLCISHSNKPARCFVGKVRELFLQQDPAFYWDVLCLSYGGWPFLVTILGLAGGAPAVSILQYGNAALQNCTWGP